MRISELSISGAWVFSPTIHRDERGSFTETFKASEFAATVGRPFDLQQINTSTSAAGVLRGIHYTEDPPGQAKYVTCTRGAFFEVIVDLRRGSPTYGQWDSVLLDDTERRSVYVAPGLGHALLALADDSSVTYLCSLAYSPELDHDMDAFDPRLGITWPTTDLAGQALTYRRSAKDAAAGPFTP